MEERDYKQERDDRERKYDYREDNDKKVFEVYMDNEKITVHTLVDLSSKLLAKCKGGLKKSQELIEELQKQLQRIDRLKDLLITIKKHMLETQFKINVKHNFLYKIFPFLLPNFQEKYSYDMVHKQLLQSEIELEITALVYRRYGQRTEAPDDERRLYRKFIQDFPDKGDEIVRNMKQTNEILYSLRLKSLSVMIELMLQLHEIPTVLIEINDTTEKVRQAAMDNRRHYRGN